MPYVGVNMRWVFPVSDETLVIMQEQPVFRVHHVVTWIIAVCLSRGYVVAERKEIFVCAGEFVQGRTVSWSMS